MELGQFIRSLQALTAWSNIFSFFSLLLLFKISKLKHSSLVFKRVNYSNESFRKSALHLDLKSEQSKCTKTGIEKVFSFFPTSKLGRSYFDVDYRTHYKTILCIGCDQVY
jgi:hypothetical protein